MSRIAWRPVIIGTALVAVAVAAGVGLVLLTDPIASDARSADAPTTTVALPVAPVTVTASADDRMNEFLDQHGNPAAQHEQMRDTAREVCRLLGATGNYNDQVTTLEVHAGMYEALAKMFLNESIDIYCPMYDEMIPH